MAMTKKRTKAGVTSSAYKRFLSNLDLYAIGLDQIEAKLDRTDYAKSIGDKRSSIVRNITTEFALSELDGDHFDVSGSFELSMGRANDAMTFLEIRASYSAHFHPKKGTFLRADAEQFAESEAKLLFWPYFRQTVADTTARMYIRPITIPLVFKP